eukprot:850035-Pleurochrysis_carterae.AAC.10
MRDCGKAATRARGSEAPTTPPRPRSCGVSVPPATPWRGACGRAATRAGSESAAPPPPSGACTQSTRARSPCLRGASGAGTVSPSTSLVLGKRTPPRTRRRVV